jgi:hypothetical protein
VYGPGDEKLGKIDDVIFDSDDGHIRYVVVDTGGWLSSRRFLVPPDELQPSTVHEKGFNVNMTKRRLSVSLRWTRKFRRQTKIRGIRPAVSQFVDSGTINQKAARDEHSPLELPKPNHPKSQHHL